MEYSLDLFVSELRNVMYESADFPFESDLINLKKHPKRNLHIKDVAFKSNDTMFVDDDKRSFDIGNYYAEQDYPYYHILQDSPVIRKRGKATEKTRGSQAKVSELGKRDYNKISFNGKTYTREYAKNIRGKRNSIVDRSTQWNNGVKINKESINYKNIHYHWIDKVLDVSVHQVAYSFGGRVIASRNTSLEEDYNESQMIEDMLSSYLD